MTKNEFLAEIAAAVSEEPSAISEATRLDQLNWTSLSTITFMAMADSELGMLVEPDLLTKAESVGDLVALVKDRLAE